MDISIAVDLCPELWRQCIHTWYTHPMQSPGYLIRFLVKFTSCMKHGHNHLEGRLILLLVKINRDPPAIIHHCNGSILIYGQIDWLTITGKCLIDGIIDYFIHQVMKSFCANITNIHSRVLPYRFQSFQHLDTICRVFSWPIIHYPVMLFVYLGYIFVFHFFLFI